MGEEERNGGEEAIEKRNKRANTSGSACVCV